MGAGEQDGRRWALALEIAKVPGIAEAAPIARWKLIIMTE
jgi:hypothetical protein